MCPYWLDMCPLKYQNCKSAWYQCVVRKNNKFSSTLYIIGARKFVLCRALIKKEVAI